MHARLHHVVLDCPDPPALARFYAALLDQPITYSTADFAVVSRDDTTSGLAFQRVAAHRPATWPDGDVQQQVHLELMVDDVAAGAVGVRGLGAVPLGNGGGFADPAGHPFCLIPRPGWAAPLDDPAGSAAAAEQVGE